jgi:hypothetical protein
MEKEVIFSLCKNEVIRLLDKFNLNVDKDTVDDLAFMSFIDCNKYWCDRGKVVNEKVIKVFVKRTMFYNYI